MNEREMEYGCSECGASIDNIFRQDRVCGTQLQRIEIYRDQPVESGVYLDAELNDSDFEMYFCENCGSESDNLDDLVKALEDEDDEDD